MREAKVVQFPGKFERWVSKQDVADYLGRTTRWVEMQVKAGMPSRMVGRRQFRLSEVDKWIDERQPS